MLGLFLLLSAAMAAHAVIASPLRSRSGYAVKETHPVPRKWTPVSRAPGQHMLHMQIGLQQEKFDELERHLYEGKHKHLLFKGRKLTYTTVSDPAHARYGHHLSVEQVHDLVRPSEDDLDLVHEWLIANGVDRFDYSPAKDWVNIYISVEDAERLLDTEYSVFQHEDGSYLVRTPEWSLPTHLHEIVDTIQPTNAFMRSTPQKTDWIQFDDDWTPPGYQPPSNETIAKVCNIASVTLECFNTLYGSLGYQQQAIGRAQIGWTNYLNQTPIRPDIFEFLARYNPPAAVHAFTFESVEIANGPAAQYTPLTPAQANGNDISKEAVLDAETILGMTWPQPAVSFSTGGSPPFDPDLNSPTDSNEPFLTWVNFVTSQEDLPQVISSSYGDDEQSIPKTYAERVCKSFAQLGARGISLLCSSGDSGLGGQDDSVCFSNHGKNTSTFLPAFPASCPYVTTVGATMEFEPEFPAYLQPGLGPDGKTHGFYASGSGFSYYFDRPSYQNGFVDKYVSALDGKYAGLYNPNGRGYPDVSAQGLYFAFFWNNTLGTISGTSASTPLMASIVSLVNDARIAAGQPTLGFLNPWIYSKAYKGFTDVVGGNTSSCGTDGFPVVAGWDPSTGFGTPVSSGFALSLFVLRMCIADFRTGLPEIGGVCAGILICRRR